MKKGLLTLAAMAFAAASMTAASYTVFDSSSMKGDWTAQGTGFATTVTVDGNKFVISTDKGSSTTALRNPGTGAICMESVQEFILYHPEREFLT